MKIFLRYKAQINLWCNEVISYVLGTILSAVHRVGYNTKYIHHYCLNIKTGLNKTTGRAMITR